MLHSLSSPSRILAAAASSGTGTLALVLALASSAHAAPLFRAPFQAFDLREAAGYLETADLNGDGKSDVVSTNQYDGTVVVSLALQGGTYAAPVSYPVSRGGSSPAVGDLTGDGHPDIAIADFPNETIGILPGHGDGTFGDTLRVATGPQTYAVLIADVNGDNKRDLIASNWTSVAILLGFGNGRFGGPVPYPTATNTYHLAIGDLNGDQKPDLVTSGDYSQVSVLLNAGNGTFLAYRELQVPSYIADLAVADATGDGKGDVVLSTGLGVSIFPGNGNGTFGSRSDLALPDPSGRFDLADLNGDSHLDIVAVSNDYYYANDEATVLLGDGLGGFPVRNIIESVYGISDVSVADFDGNATPDLVFASQLGLLAVHLGNGDGTFDSSQSYSTGPEPVAVALGDLSGDSKADLVVAHQGSSSISVRRGNGNGTFGIRLDYDVPASWAPRALALGDLDGDGHPDVAVANSPDDDSTGPAGLAVFRGYSNASFGSITSYPVGIKLSGVVMGDLDGDGDQDLVVTDEVANRASVLINAGSGSFMSPVHYGAGNGPLGVAIGDLNGDSKLDIATANHLSGSVTVLFGGGNGTFVTELELATAEDCRAVAIGLVDGDAIPDLVTANGSSRTISVLKGLGGGRFAQPAAFPTAVAPTSVGIVLLNADAQPDVAFGSTGLTEPGFPGFPPVGRSNLVGAMLGTAGETFDLPLLFGSSDEPHAIALADLDGSGRADMVVTSRGSAAVSVLMNTTSLLFRPIHGQPIAMLGRSYPSPAPATVSVRFTLTREAAVSMRVFDLSGRMVCTLARGTMGPGEHSALWDRHTDRGATATPGIYLCELSAGGRRAVTRIILL